MAVSTRLNSRIRAVESQVSNLVRQPAKNVTNRDLARVLQPLLALLREVAEANSADVSDRGVE